jgi:NADPH-dependent 2,4-dienoyl-CoA reductase/sulfur reductase-like enzyme
LAKSFDDPRATIMATLGKRDDAIVIIGAGVFGLSTALHLAQRGFKNVTVLDKQNYDVSKYSYEDGCDAPSAGELPCVTIDVDVTSHH